jgi:hypothetical protein
MFRDCKFSADFDFRNISQLLTTRHRLSLTASFFMPTPVLQLMCYVIAGVLLLWLVMISAAFAADKRRRRRFLTGQE